MSLNTFLVAFAFALSNVDPAMYIWTRGGAFVIIVVHVDDILMSGNSKESLGLLVKYIKKSFEVRVNSKLETFCGLFVKDSGNTVKFHIAPIIQRLLNAFGLQNCKFSEESVTAKIRLGFGRPLKTQHFDTILAVE